MYSCSPCSLSVLVLCIIGSIHRCLWSLQRMSLVNLSMVVVRVLCHCLLFQTPSNHLASPWSLALYTNHYIQLHSYFLTSKKSCGGAMVSTPRFLPCRWETHSFIYNTLFVEFGRKGSIVRFQVIVLVLLFFRSVYVPPCLHAHLYVWLLSLHVNFCLACLPDISTKDPTLSKEQHVRRPSLPLGSNNQE